MYFSEDAETLLKLSRTGADAVFKQEAHLFERFLQEELGWTDAKVDLPWGVYVRQTRHALDVRQRLSLDALAQADNAERIGSFCYYPDFRGFHAPKLPGPLTAPIFMGPGLASNLLNLGIASRAAGYTPFAHSLCRLVQYNATLGTALGVAASFAEDDLGAVSVADIRRELERQDILADDPTGFERNATIRQAMQADAVIRMEGARIAAG
ncbi:FAD dependent oxidoreductase [compost metagenome]